MGEDTRRPEIARGSSMVPGTPPALRPHEVASPRLAEADPRDVVASTGDAARAAPARGPRDLRFLAAAACVAVLVVVAASFAYASHANERSARDWKQRAIGLNEQVNGLRTLIGERSAQLNERTRQANLLAVNLRSTRLALRRSEGDVTSLARRQRELANEKAQLEDQRRALQQQAGALEDIAGRYIDCKNALVDVITSLVYQDYTSASSDIAIARGECNSAASALNAYVGAYG